MLSRSLSDLEVLVAIAEEGSLSGAAVRLGKSPQAVSRSLKALEAVSGTLLVARTTRTCQLTQAGERFYSRVKAVLRELEAAREEIASHVQRLSGRLTISVPTIFGPRHVVPVVSGFLRQHPEVNATLLVSDDYVDLTASTGIDIAIRAGETPDARLTARRLGSLRRVTFASREYLAEHGRPQHPDDLRRHACVIRKGVAGAANWRYRSADGAEESIPVTGRLEADSIMAVNAAVIAGAGVGRALYWQIEDLVRSGQLELLLVGFEPEPVPLRALWVPNRHMPARTRLFIDALAQALGNRSL